jgi:hypothetical protein
LTEKIKWRKADLLRCTTTKLLLKPIVAHKELRVIEELNHIYKMYDQHMPIHHTVNLAEWRGLVISKLPEAKKMIKSGLSMTQLDSAHFVTLSLDQPFQIPKHYQVAPHTCLVLRFRSVVVTNVIQMVFVNRSIYADCKTKERTTEDASLRAKWFRILQKEEPHAYPWTDKLEKMARENNITDQDVEFVSPRFTLTQTGVQEFWGHSAHSENLLDRGNLLDRESLFDHEYSSHKEEDDLTLALKLSLETTTTSSSSATSTLQKSDGTKKQDNNVFIISESEMDLPPGLRKPASSSSSSSSSTSSASSTPSISSISSASKPSETTKK